MIDTTVLQSHSAIETRRIAGVLAHALSHGCFLGLSGHLGAGKSEFARGFARALGITDEVVSPTFVLETLYDIPNPALISAESAHRFTAFHHWDLYRLSADYAAEELLEYQGDSSKIVLIEWPERVPAVTHLLDILVKLNPTEESDGREIGIKIRDPKVEERFKQLLSES